MLSKTDNEFLTRSGPGTAMGDLLRRFWMPALLSEELPERDGPPKKTKILGEDLLAFRGTDGRVGIVEPHCPHRGANLYYGRNEECGIRCAFHGWKFDVDGNCVDLPTSPPESTYKDTIKLIAYPTREWGDMIWVYMGPREKMPELPQLEMGLVPSSQRYVSKKWQDCNWVQSLEGGIDTAHFSFLHAVLTKDEKEALAIYSRSAALGDQSRPDDRVRWIRNDPRPKFSILGHDAGLVIGGARKTDGRELYWRIAQFLMPNHAFAPAAMPGEVYYGQAWVPVSDTSCWIYTYSWRPDRAFTNSERTQFDGGFGVHSHVDDDYMPVRNIRNEYLLDRTAQKHQSFTGITGVSAHNEFWLDRSTMAIEAAVNGLGVILESDILTQAEYEAGRLIAPFDDVRASLSADSYYLVTPRGYRSHHHRAAFRDWLLGSISPDRRAPVAPA